MSIKEGAMVLVVWEDIVSWSGWNDELIQENADVPKVFQTMGYFIRQNKHRLTISDTYPDIGTVTSFPAGCVIKLVELQAVKDDKNKTRKQR